MRLSLHTVVCCCVFTSVVPLVDGAPGEPSSGLKERFRVWLQSRVKRDLPNGSATDSEECFDIHFVPEQDGNAATVPPLSSLGINVRSKRSSGCVFVTCAYQDLIYRLHKLTVKEIEATAPVHKISATGYGRRRRRSSSSNGNSSSLSDAPSPRDLRAGRGSSEESGQRVRRHKSTRTVA